jgi:glycosyltransferase involved in cell wall biosynthesis
VAIPRGTDLSRFIAPGEPADIAAVRARWGVGPGQRVLLLAARLTAWKGHEFLLDAVARRREEGRAQDVVVVFAGDPQGRDDYVRHLDDHARRLGLAGSVRRVGHEADMAAALHAADVVAVSSTRPEAFGRVAVEAQAAGIPVVVTDHGAVTETVLAPPEVMADERTGWRVVPDDVDMMAARLGEALELAPAERQALAARGRRHVAVFSLEAMCAATLAVYAELLTVPTHAS